MLRPPPGGGSLSRLAPIWYSYARRTHASRLPCRATIERLHSPLKICASVSVSQRSASPLRWRAPLTTTRPQVAGLKAPRGQLADVTASLAVLAVVLPLGALAAELPNRRLRRVARTARRIADGDLEARSMVGGRGGDEITEISATVDSMADSLRDRLLTEQRFTADVAHELRTR